MRGGEGVKNICFCLRKGGGGKKWNSVHVVVEYPSRGLFHEIPDLTLIFKGNIMNIDDVTFFFIRSLLIQYDYYDYVIDETSNGKESNYEKSRVKWFTPVWFLFSNQMY